MLIAIIGDSGRAGTLFATVNPVVFVATAVIVAVFMLFGVIFPTAAGEVFGSVHAYVAEYFGWVCLLAVTCFLAFLLYLVFSRYGYIRLGQPEERPKFGLLAWFSIDADLHCGDTADCHVFRDLIGFRHPRDRQVHLPREQALAAASAGDLGYHRSGNTRSKASSRPGGSVPMSDYGRSSAGLIVVAALVIAAFVVPYTLLRDIESF